MSFVGIEINDSKITKICNNTIISTNKDSVGIKLTILTIQLLATKTM